jgi:predicted nucleic acid-binding protein
MYIALEQNRPIKQLLPLRFQVSIITVAELRAGVLAAPNSTSRASRLRSLTKAMETEPLLVDDVVAGAWAELRVALKEAGRKMAVNDSWIAATAIAHNLPLVTQDTDYHNIPKLTVINI